MKEKILSVLRTENEFVSGQQLCRQLGVSRTAVWKVISQLRQEGYQIEAVPNKGYWLKNDPDVLSEEEIKSRISGSWAGSQVFCYDQVDSTNDEAKRLADDGAAHGTLVVADTQSSGKGRRGRGWGSPVGNGIFMTLILRPELMPAAASALTLVMGLSVAKACRSLAGVPAAIKWPNDVVVNNKKVCGILTEMSAQIDYINHVVIGVGINVNNRSFPEELQEKATSLVLEKEGSYTRAPIIAAVMKCFEKDYEKFIAAQNLSLLMEEYNELLLSRRRQVEVIEPGQRYRAYALGINEKGELIVRREQDQKLIHVVSGEVSVRGICGYI